MSDGMYGRNAMGIRDGWSLKSTMPSNMWDESEDKERITTYGYVYSRMMTLTTSIFAGHHNNYSGKNFNLLAKDG